MKPTPVELTPHHAVAHLAPGVWQKVNRLLLRKMLSEFAHERIITPAIIREEDDWAHYELRPADTGLCYTFRARILALDHWYIDTASICKTDLGHPAPPDAISFVIEFRQELGLDDEHIGTYLEEVISCLQGSAYMHTYNTTGVEMLVQADYQTIERAMTAGHPCFVANSARIGFDAADYRNFTPEAAGPFRVIWLAGHKGQTEFTGIAPLDYRQVLEQELEAETIRTFRQKLLQQQQDPEQYYFFPVHPWQWFNKLAHIFAPDIANGKLVCLGYGDDNYLPQQSVRTLFNVSRSDRYYVKSALSILNMGFMRGLSPYFMRTTPAINAWVYDIVSKDAYLRSKGFTMLREVATIGYTNDYFERTFTHDTPYKKMLATLWRESPLSVAGPGQRLMTMAALLHTDAQGRALLPELIRSSGLDAATWLQHYLQCYLSPLLHCFYYYDMRFMPHGENLILVMENGIPVRAVMKDIGEEVAVVSQEIELPETVQRIRIKVPEELRLLSIFTQIFDCFFRFLNQVLVEHDVCPEEVFWEQVAECISAYQRTYPELENKFRQYDLFSGEVVRTCLNRLQLRNNKKMIDAGDPFKNQQFAGTLINPLAAFRPVPA